MTFDFLIKGMEEFCSITIKCQQSMFAFLQKKKTETEDFLNIEGDYIPISLKLVE